MKTIISVMVLGLLLQGCFGNHIDLSNSCNATVTVYINDNDTPDIKPSTKIGALP